MNNEDVDAQRLEGSDGSWNSRAALHEEPVVLMRVLQSVRRRGGRTVPAWEHQMIEYIMKHWWWTNLKAAWTIQKPRARQIVGLSQKGLDQLGLGGEAAPHLPRRGLREWL